MNGYANSIPDTMPDMVTREPVGIWRRIKCALEMHDWVSRVDLGGKPDPELVNGDDPVGYFLAFAAPVCKHCPRQLPPRVKR